MVAAGVDVVDVGGHSTRPGARAVPLAEELRRTVPVIECGPCLPCPLATRVWRHHDTLFVAAVVRKLRACVGACTGCAA